MLMMFSLAVLHKLLSQPSLSTKLSQPSPTQSTQRLEEGEEVDLTGGVVTAAETAEADSNLEKIKTNLVSQLHPDGLPPGMQMGLPVQPVLTIICTAVLHFIVQILLPVAGRQFRHTLVPSRSPNDGQASLMRLLKSTLFQSTTLCTMGTIRA